MNIIYFGSSHFGLPSLKALLNNGYDITCVVTQPDRKKGRGLVLTKTEIKKFAEDSKLKIYQPPDVNSKETIGALKSLKPDLFVVIAYGQILSQDILDIPKIISLNLHASLLPRYRGAAPINWVIINGERKTGVTVIKMNKHMDAGPVILQKQLSISDDDTAVDLEKKLSAAGAAVLLDALKSIENNTLKMTEQKAELITYAPKLKKEDGLIDWNMPAESICNLCKGCLEWPGAYTYYKGKILKFYKSGIIPTDFKGLPGEVISVSKESIVVLTGKGALEIRELQLEGKRRMKTEEFISGHKIRAGEILKSS